MENQEMILIAIQDWQAYLAERYWMKKDNKPLPEGAKVEHFENRYHPWGNGMNCKMANQAFLNFLTEKKIRYEVWSDDLR